MRFYRLVIAFFLFSDAQMVIAQHLDDRVVVFPVKMPPPPGAKKLGSLRVGNNSTKSDCDYEAMIASARRKARAMGGNLVKITQLIDPVFISKCYGIKADVYSTNDLQELPKGDADNPAPDTKNSGKAILYIYRLQDTLALATSYKLHLNNDSVICIVKKKSACAVELDNGGLITLWAETEKKQELQLNVKQGAAYYVRCGVKNGEIRMQPVLQLMNDSLGKSQYESLGKKKKHNDVEYLQQVH